MEKVEGMRHDQPRKTVPVFIMNGRENANDPLHGVPDINLNNQTVEMGGLIKQGMKEPSVGAAAIRGLGNWIRQTLCSK